jgi:hypothetical protein
MLDVSLVSADHVRRYSIALAGADGWDVTLEEDRAVRWKETWTDWHRVERAWAQIDREVGTLLELGWRLEAVSQ